MAYSEQYVVDSQGNRIAVLLGIGEYQRVLERLEELDAIEAFDRAKLSGDQAIPFDQAVEEIERGRR